jgi:hypothetical protein
MSKSYLERIAEALIKEAGLPEPIREFHFCEGRRWRCDFVFMYPTERFPMKGCILEVEGGLYMPGGGRHNRGSSMTADMEKYNEAALLGYTVLRVTKYHLINGQAIRWVKTALGIE